MHNGGIARLEDVIWFYARGTDFLEENIDNADPIVGPIPEIVGADIPQAERRRRVRTLVAFLKTLTDERIRRQRAPFDHPELPIPHGYTQTVSGGSSTANQEGWITLPAVGAGQPLRAFEDVLPPYLWQLPGGGTERRGRRERGRRRGVRQSAVRSVARIIHVPVG
jgi:hypothetical protein